jgi:hypothetical protein
LTLGLEGEGRPLEDFVDVLLVVLLAFVLTLAEHVVRAILEQRVDLLLVQLLLLTARLFILCSV